VISQRQDFHKVLHAQLMRHGAKDTRLDWLSLLIHYNNHILIEPNLAPLVALPVHRHANNQVVYDLPFLTLPHGTASVTEAMMRSPSFPCLPLPRTLMQETPCLE